MIEELWARLRGVNKWPETMATINSVFVYEKPIGRRVTQAADVSFFYRDGNNELQAGSYTADDDSPIFSAKEDDTFSVRYNPRHPERFWSEEYVWSIWQWTKIVLAGIAMVVAIVIAVIWLTNR